MNEDHGEYEEFGSEEFDFGDEGDALDHGAGGGDPDDGWF